MPIVEDTLNLAIARVLDRQRRGWSVFGEETGVLKAAGKRPDIVVRQEGRPTVLIENEFLPAANVEEEIRNRLGMEFRDSNQKAEIGVALRSPASLKGGGERRLDERVASAEFDYALFSGVEEVFRFPESGWLTGGLADVAGFVYRAAVPAKAVQGAAALLEDAVRSAAKILDKAKAARPGVDAKIEEILQQEGGEQTNRMAMAILVNALAFHDNIVGRDGVRSLAELKLLDDGVRRDAVFKEWKKILDINYRPIFRVARQILAALPERMAQEVLDRLSAPASNLAADGVVSSHDLFGGVFQRLISDRKFLATFYTRPSSAVLLANLAIPEDQPFAGGDWGASVTDYTVADFACGTGALLAAAYRRVGELHERAGGNPTDIHPKMMEKALVGCDVMPAAVHLTASMLSSAYPNQAFGKTRLDTAHFGATKDGVYSVGSLELLDKEVLLPGVFSLYTREHGSGEDEEARQEIRWRSVNLVIMNPPFTRSTKHEGDFKNVPNPAWAGFKSTPELQGKLAARAGRLRAGTCGNGNAGLASDFAALADKMVCADGTVGLVLPLSVAAGESWRGAREMWTRNYEDVRVVTIAAPRIGDCSFSADTGMGEMLFIGKRRNGRENGRPARKGRRGVFIILRERAQTEIESAEVARIIRGMLRGKIRKLEDGPYGGTVIRAGKTAVGEMLDAPLPECPGGPDDAADPWEVVRIRDLSLAQTAHALANGRLWFAGESKSAADIPVCNLGRFARRGFMDRDICGINRGGNGGPRGPFDRQSPCVKTATYPCLWAHDAKRETTMLIEPDSECRVRIGMEARAEAVWKTASRAHFSGGFQFNSQPLAVAMTSRPSIGGPAWRNVILQGARREEAFALWGNSTLGLMLYWWWANKQQEGRGHISPVRVPGVPTLNIARLDAKQLNAARRGFNALRDRPLLPFYRAVEDKTRAELDRVVLCEVLGLPKKVLSGVALVREKLCAEPSVCGGKKDG